MKKDKDCICEGNWRLLVKECENKFNQRYVRENGKEYVFFGLVMDNEDYYYGLIGKDNRDLVLTSCVMGIEDAGFKLKE